MPTTSGPARRAAVVLGTRPEIIKLGPLLRELGDDALLIHSGQHYNAELSDVFLAQFGLDGPDEVLGIGGMSRGGQIGRATIALDERLARGDIGTVIVQGDTNTTAAGALAANSRGIPLLHVEAGLRSHDRAMPEEHNRVIADQLSDLCCAATSTNVDNLRAAGITDERIALTGNTIVEALTSLLPDEGSVAAELAAHHLEPDGFVLGTFHRPENVDEPAALRRIIDGLATLDLPVVLPLHPRTRDRLRRFEIVDEAAPGRIRLVEPLDYQRFLALQSTAALVVSDSGGVQEEVTILRRPLVVVRNSTERPESLDRFARLVRPDDDLRSALNRAMADARQWGRELESVASPYGDGTATATIATLVRERLEH